MADVLLYAQLNLGKNILKRELNILRKSQNIAQQMDKNPEQLTRGLCSKEYTKKAIRKINKWIKILNN